jgi:hypothetical protein
LKHTYKKYIKEIIMEENINNINNIKDMVGVIWLTMVGYIIYLEFFKG